MKNDTPGTEPQAAPDTTPAVAEPAYVAPQPRQKTIERQGVRAEPYTRRYPEVRGGICEFCGVIDQNYPSEFQYKLCQHYAGMQLRCSYCDETKNPDEVIGHSRLQIAGHPDNPDTLIVWCDSFTCSEKHLARFDRSRK